MHRAVLSIARALCAASVALPYSLPGQSSGQSVAPMQAAVRRTVRGRVIDGTRNDRAVAGTTVVLHRISSAAAGPLDSVRTNRSGAFTLSFEPTGEALYLVSVSYAGIGYFSSPLTADTPEPADPIDIVVYDTSSTGRSVAVRGRHFIVSQPDARGLRAVVEVFELANDSTVTFVSERGGPPVWTIHLPSAAIAPRLREGEFAKDAVTFAGGEVQLFAPLPPGMKQLVLSYELPPGAFPLSLPVERPSGMVEVLLEETAGTAQGARLQPQEAVTGSGRRFRRSMAQDVDSSAVVTIALPAASVRSSAASAWLLVPIALAVALGIWWVARRRPTAAPTSALASLTPAPQGPVSAPDHTRDELAARVATLDALLAADPGMAPALRAHYTAERDDVMRKLREVLGEYT